MNWHATTLEEVAEFTNGGPWNQSEYTDSGVPVARVTNFVNESIDLSDCKYLSPESFTKYRKHELHEGDLVVATVGSHPSQPASAVGRPVRVPRSASGCLLNQNAVCIRPKRDNKLNQRFLFFFAQTDHFRQYILANARGAANQARMSIERLRRMPLSMPTLPTQRKIASILSVYDDLIENNSRRIAILEEMAQAIYREWFVNFRFPGHENVKLVESTLGLIPEGWQTVALSTVADVNGKSIKNGVSLNYINYIDIASVSTGRIDDVRSIAFTEAPGRARRIVGHGDVIWSTVRPNRRSYCIVIDPLPDTIVSTGFAVLSPKSIPFSYLYYAVTTDDFASYLVNHATGSAYPAVNSKDFADAEIMLPSIPVINRFHDVVGETLLLAHRLKSKNRNLRTTRDLLLPKLISGQLDVEELDIDLGLTSDELQGTSV